MNKTLADMLVEEIKDLYDAEHLFHESLGALAEKAKHPELKKVFEDHKRETKLQIKRLEEVFEALGEKPERQKCKAAAGLIAEAEHRLKEEMSPDVRDVALIGAAQRMEHYEIAGYGCAANYARLLGEYPAMNLLLETLQEEKNADHLLTKVAEEINLDAMGA
jgi:ferritin-like metal-binding protein YciE